MSITADLTTDKHMLVDGQMTIDGKEPVHFTAKGILPLKKEVIDTVIKQVLTGVFNDSANSVDSSEGGELEASQENNKEVQNLNFDYCGIKISREAAETLVAIDFARSMMNGDLYDLYENILYSGLAPITEMSDKDVQELLSMTDVSEFSDADLEEARLKRDDFYSNILPTENNSQDEKNPELHMIEMILKEAEDVLENLKLAANLVEKNGK